MWTILGADKYEKIPSQNGNIKWLKLKSNINTSKILRDSIQNNTILNLLKKISELDLRTDSILALFFHLNMKMIFTSNRLNFIVQKTAPPLKLCDQSTSYSYQL